MKSQTSSFGRAVLALTLHCHTYEELLTLAGRADADGRDENAHEHDLPVVGVEANPARQNLHNHPEASRPQQQVVNRQEKAAKAASPHGNQGENQVGQPHPHGENQSHNASHNELIGEWGVEWGEFLRDIDPSDPLEDQHEEPSDEEVDHQVKHFYLRGKKIGFILHQAGSSTRPATKIALGR